MIDYKKYIKLLIILIPILVLALTIRIYNLTEIPVFADEAIYIRWAQVMKSESTLRFLPLSDGKQPLFMWVVIPFTKLFTDPLVSGRFVSVLTGLGTIIGASFVALELFKSKKAAVVTAMLLTFSPYIYFFDRIALVDSMLTMFGVWSFYFVYLTAKNLRLDTAMLAGFMMGGAWLTKSPALFFLLMAPFVYITVLPSNLQKKDWGEEGKKIIKFLALLMVSITIAFGMYNILRLGPNFHLIAQRNQDYVNPISHLWTNPLDPFRFHVQRVGEWIGNLGPWPIYLMAFIAMVTGWKKHKRSIVVLLIWVLFPILVNSMYAKVFTTRYILFAIPYLLILAGSFVSTKFKFDKYIVPVVLILFFATSINKNYMLATNPENAHLPQVMRSGYLEEWTSGTGIKESAKYIIDQHLQSGEEIIVGTEGYFGTLPDGMQIYTQNYPGIVVVGVGLNFTEIPQQLIDARNSGKDVYLVANSSRLSPDFWENVLGNVEVIMEIPKGLRDINTNEYTKHGERDYFYLLKLN